MENQQSLVEYFRKIKEKNRKVFKFADFLFDKIVREERGKVKSAASRANSSVRNRKVVLEPIVNRTNTSRVLKDLN